MLHKRLRISDDGKIDVTLKLILIFGNLLEKLQTLLHEMLSDDLFMVSYRTI